MKRFVLLENGRTVDTTIRTLSDKEINKILTQSDKIEFATMYGKNSPYGALYFDEEAQEVVLSYSDIPVGHDEYGMPANEVDHDYRITIDELCDFINGKDNVAEDLWDSDCNIDYNVMFSYISKEEIADKLLDYYYYGAQEEAVRNMENAEEAAREAAAERRFEKERNR